MIERLMALTGYDEISFWIVATAALVNIACGILGCFLVLRRMSMLGDAISHAVLPGLAIGFIVTESRAMLPMLLGALAAGVLTALLTQMIHRYARVPEDAAMGVVFTSLFALGVLMIHRIAHDIDLDPDCVLHGILEGVAFEKGLGDVMPRPTFNMLIICVLTVMFVCLLWKELKIVSFDPALAESQGYRTNLVHYLMMGMVAGVTVAAFEAVGSILVVAMLIVPAATAHLLTDRLALMVVLSAFIGVVCAVLGRDAASRMETSVSGMMAVVSGGIFVVAVLFAPRHGYLLKVLRQWGLSLRIVQEDCLALLYRWQEGSPGKALTAGHAVAALGGGAYPRIALWLLQRDGRVRAEFGGVALTEKGSTQAQTLVKSHRLWETYLASLGLPPDHVHAPADRTEHFLNEAILRDVAEQIDHAQVDPHGRPIPKRDASRVNLEKRK